MPDLVVLNNALVYGTHPITGEPMGPQDTTTVDALGEVIQAVLDREGRFILKYSDGHLFTLRVEGDELVSECYRRAEVLN